MFSSLFTNVAVDVPVVGTPAVALTALKARLTNREIRGKVELAGIRLKLRGLLPHRPYQPLFRGLLDASVTPTRLRGMISTPFLLKICIWLWLGFAFFWTLGTLVATQLDGELQWLPLGGVLMLALGYAFFSLMNSFVAGLARKLESTLRDAVAESPNKSLERTREG
jgi:hypothetical protein